MIKPEEEKKKSKLETIGQIAFYAIGFVPYIILFFAVVAMWINAFPELFFTDPTLLDNLLSFNSTTDHTICSLMGYSVIGSWAAWRLACKLASKVLKGSHD